MTGLLASPNWRRSTLQPAAADPVDLSARVAAWTMRKARLFTEDHVQIAAKRSAAHHLLPV